MKQLQKITANELTGATFCEPSSKKVNAQLEKSMERAVDAYRLKSHKANIWLRLESGTRVLESAVLAFGRKYLCVEGNYWLPISAVETIEVND